MKGPANIVRSHTCRNRKCSLTGVNREIEGKMLHFIEHIKCTGGGGGGGDDPDAVHYNN